MSQLPSEGSNDSSMEVDSQCQDDQDAPHLNQSLVETQTCGSDLPGSQSGLNSSPTSVGLLWQGLGYIRCQYGTGFLIIKSTGVDY